MNHIPMRHSQTWKTTDRLAHDRVGHIQHLMQGYPTYSYVIHGYSFCSSLSRSLGILITELRLRNTLKYESLAGKSASTIDYWSAAILSNQCCERIDKTVNKLSKMVTNDTWLSRRVSKQVKLHISRMTSHTRSKSGPECFHSVFNDCTNK